MNFIAGEISESPPSVGERSGGDVWFVSTDGTIAVPWPAAGVRPMPGTRLLFGVRPEDVGVATNSDSSRPSASQHHVEIDALVDLAEPLGNETFVHATAGSNPITARSTSRQLPIIGSNVRFTIDPARGHWFDLETGNRVIDPSSP
jgi:multiple sugar transport system ATP-binding protein